MNRSDVRQKPNIHDEYILANYQTKTVPEMARELKRVQRVVRQICIRLNVQPLSACKGANGKNAKDWTKIDAYIIANNDSMRNDQMAKELGVKVYIVQNRKVSIGLSNRQRSAKGRDVSFEEYMAGKYCLITGFKLNKYERSA